MSDEKVATFSAFHEYINSEKFKDYGFEEIYVQHQIKILKMIDLCGDIHRLYLISQLDESNYNAKDAYAELTKYSLPRDSQAVTVTNSLKTMIPDADPIYLDLVGECFAYNQEGLDEFIDLVTTKTKPKYPKLNTYKERIKFINTIKSLTINFDIEDFVDLCPDPMNFIIQFNSKAKVKFNEEKLMYLIDRFPNISLPIIREKLVGLRYDLMAAAESLENIASDSDNLLQKERKSWPSGVVNFLEGTDNIDFLKEIAFVENKESILFHKEVLEASRNQAIEEAMILNTLYKCECCYETNFLDDEIGCCPKGHPFCYICIKKYVEMEIGLKKLEFKCMTECTENLNIEMLKQIIDTKLYERLMRLKQAEDIKAAEIEGLETCAFCDYSAIVPQDHLIFGCLNPECGKETCRTCREENHTPLKCDEVERSPEIEIRTMIENKMSEVVIRTCPSCDNKFLKENGCNRITCICGAFICYICKKVLHGAYEHFYHDVAIMNRCPLYTDENVIHVSVVEAAARLIVDELKVSKPELLDQVDITKLLPAIKGGQRNTQEYSVYINNEIIASILGVDMETINGLSDMRPIAPN